MNVLENIATKVIMNQNREANSLCFTMDINKIKESYSFMQQDKINLINYFIKK